MKDRMMKNRMASISLRAPEKIIKEAERLAKLEYVDKSLILREALEKGLSDMGLDIAIKLFSEGKVSLSEAAQIADISAGEMMDNLVKRGIRSGVDEDDLKNSLRIALKRVR